MRSLFDVSALIALLDSGHVFHARIRQWWAANADDGWATCPITQNGFARVLSQANYPNRRPIAEAIEVLTVAVRQPGHQFWPDSVSLTDELFDRRHILGPKQLTDVYLLALAVTRGGRLVTLDHRITRSPSRGAEERHLVLV